MIKYLIKTVAKWLAKIGGEDFDNIVFWVMDLAEENLEGWQKAEEVIKMFNEEWGDRAGFVARTVVQLAYAYAKIKGLLK